MGLGVGTWFLAGVFLWSGAGKVRHPRRTAVAIFDFGAVRNPKPSLGLGLGVAELVLSFSLAAASVVGSWKTALASLTGAAVILWIFVILISRSLSEHKTFACFCFGDTQSTLSAWTLLRTAGLALMATLLAVVAPGATLEVTLKTNLLQAESAAALLMASALLGRFQSLIRRSEDPFFLQREGAT